MFSDNTIKQVLSLFLVLFLLTPCAVRSQNDSVSHRKNAIYFEIGGAQGAHSMNYERIIKLKPLFDLNLRAGYGFDNLIDYNGNFNPDFALPVMAGASYGLKHKVECGVGQTFSNTIETDIQTGEPTRQSNFSTTFYLGYRYQNPEKRLLFRAGYSPIIEFNDRYKHWAGVSIGFIF